VPAAAASPSQPCAHTEASGGLRISQNLRQYGHRWHTQISLDESALQHKQGYRSALAIVHFRHHHQAGQRVHTGGHQSLVPVAAVHATLQYPAVGQKLASCAERGHLALTGVMRHIHSHHLCFRTQLTKQLGSQGGCYTPVGATRQRAQHYLRSASGALGCQGDDSSTLCTAKGCWQDMCSARICAGTSCMELPSSAHLQHVLLNREPVHAQPWPMTDVRPSCTGTACASSC
jgi:hypothetical protein